MKLTIVDVFAEKPLAGNQLAVVQSAEGLTSEQMQSIAREMNFSETTFVTSEADDRASVRIFTPSSELPFAGHPTLGTAWLLAGGKGTFTLDLAGGAVPVSFAEGVGWMTPPPVALGGVLDPERSARLIGLVPEQLAAGYPARFAVVGPEFILIGVNDLAALRESALNEELHKAYQEEGLAVAHVFVFTDDAYGPDADFASRMFFDAGGVREDPATGSANSAFAAYLKDLRGGSFEVVMDQGVEMKRPSRLYLRVGDVLQVGGRTQLVSRGELASGIF